MLLTKMKLAAMFVATVSVTGLLAAPFFAPAKKTLVKKITRLDNDIGDVASLLHVQKQVLEVELHPKIPFTNMSVEIEIYKDGQKQITNLPRPRFSIGKRDHPIDRAKIALLAADLDYLPLAQAVKGHHRVQVEIELKGARTAGSTDVPKELFDFSRVSASGRFPPEAGSETEAQLFYLKARSHELTGADTVPEFIQKNSKGDVLIVYLRVRNE